MTGLKIRTVTGLEFEVHGERQQKFKRGFITKKEAQAWERDFLQQKTADVNMTFESFVQLYEKDITSGLMDRTSSPLAFHSNRQNERQRNS